MATDGSLIFDTKVDESGFKKGLDRLRGIASKSFGIVTKAIKAGAAALSGFAVAAIKMGSDFEAGMSRVQALSGATGAEFEALRKTALELGRTTVFSASQAAEGMQYLAMAGFKTNEIIAAMPGVLNAAAAGQVDLATAADITSNVLSGFGLKAEEAARVADVLTKAFTSSNTTMESLGETMKYAAPVAAAAGIALEEVAAAAGMLGDAGIQGSQAGTTLRAIMLRLINPPKQAAEALDALGVSITDAEGKMKPLHQIIRELDKATQGMTDSQRAAIIAQIAGQEAASGLLAIMDMGADSLEQFTKELENAGGTAEEIAKVQLDNLRGDIELLKSALEGTGITIYDSLNTPLRTVTQTLTGYVEEINKTLTAHDDIKAKAEELGVTVEELGINLAEVPNGIEGAIGVLGNILADMVTKVADFAPKMVEAGVNLIQSFLVGIMESLDYISGAALDIGQTFIEAIFTLMPDIVWTGIGLVDALIRGIAKRIPDLIAQGIRAISQLIDDILGWLPYLVDAGIQLITALANGIIENLPTLMEIGTNAILTILEGIEESLPTLLETAYNVVMTLAKALVENIDLLLFSAIVIVEALIEFIVQNLPLLTEAALEIITALIDYLIENLPMLVDSAVELIMAIVEGLINNIDLLVEAALELVIGIVQGLLNNLPLLVNAAIQLVLALTSGLLKMLPNLVETGIVLISRLIGAILGMIPRIISTGAQLLGELIIGIIKAIPQLLSLGPRIIQTIVQGIRGSFSGIVNIGKDIVRGLWDGIKSMFGWLGGKVKSIGSVITGGIKKAFGIASPSKVMRDEVGKNLTLGIGEGFEDEIPKLQRETEKELGRLIEKMKATVELESLTVGAKLSAGSGIVRTTQNIIHNDNGITQNIHFNQPVQSPSETARHIKRIGRELALGY